MINQIIKNIKELEQKALITMLIGFKFCILLGFIASIILLFNILNPYSYIIYECGIILFKNSILYICTFFICAIVMDNIKKSLL